MAQSQLVNYFNMCYQNGTVSDTQLQQAVSKGYITQEEYMQIILSAE